MTGWACSGWRPPASNPLDVGRGRGHADRLPAPTIDTIEGAGDLERTILVLEGAGLDSRRLRVATWWPAAEARDRADGSWGGQVNPTAFGDAGAGRGRALGRQAAPPPG